jgi:hypothetical protein
MAAVLPRFLIAGALVAGWLCAAGIATAGGPLLIRPTGLPYVWSTAAAIAYRTDNGPLSATIDQAQAQARVNGMFDVWESVATASINYNRVGFINPTGAFSDGDVSTLAEYNAVTAACNSGTQSPVVYDTDGSILVALSMDETSVIGFAGPCAVNATQIVSGGVTMNGLFQDGAADVPDLTATQYDAAFVHEIGHFSGLDHSQVNVNCLNPCNADDLTGLPTMFPFLVHSSQIALAVDDIAWISRLYPENSFATTHGTITGHVFFTDGESHAQLVNVIARRVDSGGNQDRTTAVSNVSGYKFRVIHGNPITNPVVDDLGTEAPDAIGLFEIPVPAGTYTIEVESINEEFIEGSSVGGPIFIPMPGTAPAPSGPVAVAAGATSAGNDVTLIGTPPRFDQFEGPGP